MDKQQYYKLYKDINTEEYYTFEELKNKYEIEHDIEMDIPESEFHQIIMVDLNSHSFKNGHIEIINDEIVEFCNKFADYFNEGGRYLSPMETQESIKDMYINISCGKADDYMDMLIDDYIDTVNVKVIEKNKGEKDMIEWLMDICNNQDKELINQENKRRR